MPRRLLKPAVFAAALLPAVVMIYQAIYGGLGPDPAETLIHGTGEWATRLLIAALLVSPLRPYFPPLGSLRRMLGLFTFAYASIHLLLFLQFDLGWSVARVWEEVLERPYVTAGFGAWLILLPLAVTSTRGWQRRLRRGWKRLHQGVYAVALLVSLHVIWQARSDLGEALVYTGILGALLLWRLAGFLKTRAAFNRSLEASKPA